MTVKTEWWSNDGAFGIWHRIFSQRQRDTNLLQHADNGIAQCFSKSGLRTGRELNPDPTSYFKCTRITQTSVRGTHTRTHTHTHTHAGAWTSVAVFTDSFVRQSALQLATFWINLKLSFSRIMSPVSPREREVSPSRRSLSPPAELTAHSKNRTAADLWMNAYKTAFLKTYHCWLAGHMNMIVVHL